MEQQILRLAILLVLAADPSVPTGEAEPLAPKQWLPVFDSVATEYELRPAEKSQPLKLITTPVYKWARPGPSGGTNGAVYVWTGSGCAEAVACFWRSPTPDGKSSNIAHELHSLSPSILKSERGGSSPWQPDAGLKRQLVPKAPPPEAARCHLCRSSRVNSARQVASRERPTGKGARCDGAAGSSGGQRNHPDRWHRRFTRAGIDL